MGYKLLTTVTISGKHNKNKTFHAISNRPSKTDCKASDQSGMEFYIPLELLNRAILKPLPRKKKKLMKQKLYLS